MMPLVKILSFFAYVPRTIYKSKDVSKLVSISKTNKWVAVISKALTWFLKTGIKMVQKLFHQTAELRGGIIKSILT